MGGGVIRGFSRKQKINAKSSTKAELIGLDDALPQILWTWYFIECQGYAVDSNIVFQDNKSTIILGSEGKDAGLKHV